ncbi:MAG: transferrin receptor-like dimerization domain-containing protein, partial [Rhodothermales bacterium]
NADVLPFTFANFADNVARYVEEVTKLADRRREETEQHNALVAADAHTLAADPTRTYVAPRAKPPVPYLNFAPLQNALARLEASAKGYDAALHDRMASDEGVPAPVREALNDILLHAERAMTRPEGLPRRSWFRHQIYAPGFYTGYGVKTLPGVREAIEQRDWNEATEQIQVVARILEQVAHEMDRATEALAVAE